MYAIAFPMSKVKSCSDVPPLGPVQTSVPVRRYLLRPMSRRRTASYRSSRRWPKKLRVKSVTW